MSEVHSHLPDWQSGAVDALTHITDPGIQFAVLARTASTGTDKLDLLRVKDREELQALIATLERDGVPEGHLPIVMDDRGGRIEDAGVMCAGLDATLFSTQPQLFPGAVRSHQTEKVVAPDFIVHNEYAEIESLAPRIGKLAQIIYRHFVGESTDLVLALLSQYIYITNVQSISPEVIRAKPIEIKKEIIQALFTKIEPLRDEEEISIVRWALGTKFMHRLAKEHKEAGTQLDAVKNLLETNANFRRKLLRALYAVTLTSARMMASAIIRWGWQTIRNIDEVTDHEWWTYVRESHTTMSAQIEAGDAAMLKTVGTLRGRERFDLRTRRIEDFFRLNPNPPAPEEVQQLRTVIGCDRLRSELTKIETEHNPRAYDEKQREILARVSGAVSRYVIERKLSTIEDPEPSWKLGFPMHLRASKDATCFTGPWLIAVMLMECGIHYSDLLYAHVNQAHDGQIGGHGGLVLKTLMGHAVFIDHGYNFACRDLPRAGAATKTEAELIGALLNGKINESVTVLFANHEVDQIHRHMQLMPLTDGFSSGHLYHIGLSFFIEDHFDRAQYAFELALTFNRQDPDILYHLGLVALRMNDYDHAEGYFQEALRIFSNHLFSRFGLGELAVRQGNLPLAKECFKAVSDSKFNVWRADGLKENAARYAVMEDDALQALFAA